MENRSKRPLSGDMTGSASPVKKVKGTNSSPSASNNPSATSSVNNSDDLPKDTRTSVQKDHDKVIFSGPFRRLAGKTQVFPLAQNDSVHTRLTHSLEVSSVGRQLGREMATLFENKGVTLKVDDKSLTGEKYTRALEDIVATSCLLHDIGNPPFGHSGEASLRQWWKEWDLSTVPNIEVPMNWKSFSVFKDFKYFEGNAFGYRIIRQKIPGLSYITEATYTKYPRPAFSDNKTAGWKNGLYVADLFNYALVANRNNIEFNEDFSWNRHAFTYLMEAADDICNSVIDIEDGHRMNILNKKEAIDTLCHIGNLQQEEDVEVKEYRSAAIGQLFSEVKTNLTGNIENIIGGSFGHAVKKNKKVEEKLQKLFTHTSVIEVEAAGFLIIKDLMDKFVRSCLLLVDKNEISFSMRDLKSHPEASKFFLMLPEEVREEIRGIVNGVEKVVNAAENWKKEHELTDVASICKVLKDKGNDLIKQEDQRSFFEKAATISPVALILLFDCHRKDEAACLYLIYSVILTIAVYVTGMTDKFATKLYKVFRGQSLLL